MSDLTERVARMLAEYVEPGSADRMAWLPDGDLVPFWTQQVPFARDVLREVLGLLGPLPRLAAALYDHPDDTVLWQLPDGTDLLLGHVRWTAEFGHEP